MSEARSWSSQCPSLHSWWGEGGCQLEGELVTVGSQLTRDTSGGHAPHCPFDLLVEIF